MFMLKCAANYYRLAYQSARDNCNPDVIAYYLATARHYDAKAKK